MTATYADIVKTPVAGLKPVQRAALGSLLSSLAGQAALVLTGVLSARMLGVENRGYLALLVLWPAVLSKLGGLGVPLAIPYYLAGKHELAGKLARSLIRPASIQFVGLVVIHACILLVLLQGRPQSVQIAGLVTLVAVPASLLQEYALAILQGQQRFIAFNILRSMPPSAYAASLVLAFVLGGKDIVLVASLLMVTSVVVALITSGILISGMSLETGSSIPRLRHLVRFGLSGLLGSISPTETFRLDQAVIGLAISPNALGIYVVAQAFTNLPRFISQSAGMIAYPHIAALRDWTSRRVAMMQFLRFTMILTIPVVGLLILQARVLVPFFFGSSFAPAADVARVLLVGAVFLAARRILTDGSRGAGVPSAGSVAEVASWIWLVPGVLLLAPRWGVIGVAYAFTSASVFSLMILLLALIRSAIFIEADSGTNATR